MPMSFWKEIRRRKIVQVAATYAVVAWLLVQVVSAIVEPLGLPDWFDTAVIVLLAIGFPITLTMSWAFNLTATGFVRDEGGAAAGALGTRRLEYALIGLLVIAVGWVMYRVEFGGGGDSLVERGALPNSIAVLLCDSFSTDPENDFFAWSLHEEILNQLVKLRDLNVIARTSVLQYADVAMPITDIAEELKVESVMECSVAYGEGRIVISTQLIDGDTGVHIWSERYAREFEDVFGIQADIAMNVANALAVTFSSEEQQAIAEPPTSSPDAYALYLRVLAASGGRFPLAGGGGSSREGLIDRALELDPDFALAYALKAELLDSYDEAGALAAVETALELDSKLGIAHAALADVHRINWRVDEARQAFAHALEFSPNDADVLSRYAMFEAITGRRREAISAAQTALSLDPKNFGSYMTLAWVNLFAGQSQAAAAAAQEAIQIAPAVFAGHTLLATIETSRGNTTEAREQLHLGLQLIPDNALNLPRRMQLAYDCRLAGLTEEALDLIGGLELADVLREGGVDVFSSMLFYHLAREDYDAALVAMNTALEERPPALLSPLGIIHIGMNIWNDPRLEEPAFREVLAKLPFSD
jgi:TolB-like protein/tetratricopeptide (TPR) repeat protein